MLSSLSPWLIRRIWVRSGELIFAAAAMATSVWYLIKVAVILALKGFPLGLKSEKFISRCDSTHGNLISDPQRRIRNLGRWILPS